jgi:GDP-4-dehydro-6-deoxy-D-mannose reductase
VRALVTGADGFVGRHLVAHLRDSGDEVIEAGGPHATGPGILGLELRDGDAVRQVIASTQPDAVYHLAAIAYGPDAVADLDAALDVTVGGTARVLVAAADVAQPPVVLVSGSAEVYGAPAVDPIDEEAPIRPTSLYGATKAAQEALGAAMAASRGLRVIATRSFNHIGPGQRAVFVAPAFARQLRDVAVGRQEPRIRVGNLSPVRDFTDVRDVVAAYRLLVAGEHHGAPVNVASGTGISIDGLLRRLIDLAEVEVAVEVDPGRVRANDPPRIVGDASRLRRLTGWTPRYRLDETLRDVWADACQRFP